MKKVITYEAPDVTVFRIQSEGTLCVSGVDGVTVQDLGYDDDDEPLGC